MPQLRWDARLWLPRCLRKPTSAIGGSHDGLAENADELVGIQVGFARKTLQINSWNSHVRPQELRPAGKITA